jgi:hypothetical protein
MTTITKDEILSRVSHADVTWFLTNEALYTKHGFKMIQDENDGDGKQRRVTINIPRYDLYVTLIGIYHSFGESSWLRVGQSTPYEHTEIRYKFK